MFNYRQNFVVLLLTSLVCSVVYAGHDHSHKKEHQHNHNGHHHDYDKDNLGSHVHGVSELTLALDGEFLEIEFTSPTMNIVGFEYVAKNKGDIQKAKAVAKQMKKPASFFVLSGGGCALETVEVDFSGVLRKGKKHADGRHHDDHHDHGKSDEAHSEIKAHYKYKCSDASGLKSVTTTLMKSFSGIEKINAQWATPKGQQAKTLSPTDMAIEF